MNDHDAPPPGMWPSELYAERRRGTGPMLADAARALAELLPPLLRTDPFVWDVESEPPEQVALDRATLERLLSRLRRGRPFLLADRAADWTAMLAVQVDERAGLETATLSLPSTSERPLASLDVMVRLVDGFARALGAHVAFVRDAAVLHAFAGRRAHERSFASLPAQVRAFVPIEPFEELPGLAEPVPQLHVAQELPTDRVPSAVYWINWWSAPIVDTLGRERVLAAGWARIAPHADGALTLVATPQPPDLTTLADVRVLASIVTALELPELQRRMATS